VHENVPPLDPTADESARALNDHLPEVYEALRRIAHRLVRTRDGLQVIEPTELVHECYIKLQHSARSGRLSRGELLALGATAIRTLLVDRARELARLKRGGGMQRVTLNADSLVQSETIDLLALDSALARLAEIDPRMARVVELRFFAGLDPADVASTLEITPREVEREWAMARAWLHRELAP